MFSSRGGQENCTKNFKIDRLVPDQDFFSGEPTREKAREAPSKAIVQS